MSGQRSDGDDRVDPTTDEEIIDAIRDLTEPSAATREAIEEPHEADLETRIAERLVEKRRKERSPRRSRWWLSGVVGATVAFAALLFMVPLSSTDSFELEVVGGDRAFRGAPSDERLLFTSGSAIELRVRPRAAGAPSTSEPPSLWLETKDNLERVLTDPQVSPEGAIRWRLTVGRDLPAERGSYELRVVFDGRTPDDTADPWRVRYDVREFDK